MNKIAGNKQEKDQYDALSLEDKNSLALANSMSLEDQNDQSLVLIFGARVIQKNKSSNHNRKRNHQRPERSINLSDHNSSDLGNTHYQTSETCAAEANPDGKCISNGNEVKISQKKRKKIIIPSM